LLEEEAAVRIPPRSEAAIEGNLQGVLEQHGWDLARSLGSVERLMIDAAMNVSGGNQAKAARKLGITPRSMYNKIHRR